MNGSLSFYECSLSGGDTRTLPSNFPEHFALRGCGDAKTSSSHL